MENYKTISKIGEGAHGIVLKAQFIQTGQIVALKKVPFCTRLEDQGIPTCILREIKSLQQIDHINVIKLRQVFPFGNSFVLVFDYMITDLSEVLRNTSRHLYESEIKCIMKMLLKGIAFCHENNILHRDLKPANLLLSSDGILKLADFGLSRVHSEETQKRPYSHQVATRWYRAPELLYGARKYDMGIDIWSVGCIFGELINHYPLFPGSNDIDQLSHVLSTLGTPTQDSWPDMESLPDFNKIQFPFLKGIPFEQICPDGSPEAIQLLREFLKYNGSRRISSKKALLNGYFFKSPLPCHPKDLPLNKKQTNEFKAENPLDLSLFIPSIVSSLY